MIRHCPFKEITGYGSRDVNVTTIVMNVVISERAIGSYRIVKTVSEKTEKVREK